MIVVLLGPPGCGKGTQGERVAAALGVPKLSTGEVLRDAVKAGTTLGLEAKGFMEHGDLVPDPVILGIMKDALAAPAQARGVVLDGVVRTVPQAEGLAQVLTDLGRPLGLVMDFVIPDDALVKRLSGRTVCDACQSPFSGRSPGETHAECPKSPKGTLVRRKDDEPDSIRNRLKVYHAQTAPVLDWYKAHGARIATIDALGTPDEVTKRSLKAVGRA
ncbi:MAG TPA: adenylate kinase [Gemmatimonadaceae bacterium]|uniref:Adenylate kinase n=1 Tax=uncultured Gemmatimonadetes bacterium Rifle_16ft_4_minimus_37772 TaxID=1665097 RepID=A0A0H4T7S6_9BACT|nr:adk, adenylate kinase, adenylate kinase [uncultured Gemmatimonadetes bacterium Rifle_16ft_4_minimus_37772]HLA90113.1 adenylate kinase [Gemmatimonadaceae bacterium]